MSNDPAPPCPECRGTLAYRDSRKRILRREGGIRQWVVIRRFRCCQCGRLHNELPDCMVPYKHYHAEVISGVLDGVVSPEDLESEDYPCAETMRLWIQWLAINLERIEGYLRSIAYEISDYCQEVITSDGWRSVSGPSATAAAGWCPSAAVNSMHLLFFVLSRGSPYSGLIRRSLQ